MDRRDTPYAPKSDPAGATGRGAGSANGNGGKGNGTGDAADPRPSRYPWRDVDPVPPDPELLARHGAVVLDPLTALRLPGQPAPRPTVYVADSSDRPDAGCHRQHPAHADQ